MTKLLFLEWDMTVPSPEFNNPYTYKSGRCYVHIHILSKIITFPHRLSTCPLNFSTLGSRLSPVSILKLCHILMKFYIKASGKSSHSNTNCTFNRLSGLQHYFYRYFKAPKTSVTLKITKSKTFFWNKPKYIMRFTQRTEKFLCP
jgi:hypothetical protein